MIERYWSANTTKPAEEHRRHCEEVVVTNLDAFAGFDGRYLLESKSATGQTRFVALTLSTSTDAIKAFTGEDWSVAIRSRGYALGKPVVAVDGVFDFTGVGAG